jgi:glycosyl transferase family 4
MRILLMNHASLAQSEGGRLVRKWALALAAAGHDLRILLVDDGPATDDGTEGVLVERVVCRPGDAAADLPFDLPRFFAAGDTHGQRGFSALSDQELTQYRDRLRRRLDSLIDRFDPHVLHIQHIWVLGQLSLESGVPYVLNAWPDELLEYDRDPRYRALADQAAENAGRILVPDEAMQRQVAERFESAADRLLIMPNELVRDSTEQAKTSDSLLVVYQAVLDERFGRRV